MSETSYTLDQYIALKAAIAEGVNEVWYGDKRVAFRTLAEMKQILSDMSRELGLSSTKKHSYPSFSKGLE